MLKHSSRKGKTYEEFYGKEKAILLKNKISQTVKRISKRGKFIYVPYIILLCDNCKKDIKRRYKNNHKNFCSRICYNKWKKENNYIRPPSQLGKHRSEKWKKQHSIFMKEQYKNGNRKKFIEWNKKRLSNKDTHPRTTLLKKRKEQGLYKGLISKPQIELYNIIKHCYKEKVELEFPLQISLTKCCFLDIAIPKLKLNYEYDSYYWHKDENKDKMRDEKLEFIGWKTIRIDKDFLNLLKEKIKITKEEHK